MAWHRAVGRVFVSTHGAEKHQRAAPSSEVGISRSTSGKSLGTLQTLMLTAMRCSINDISTAKIRIATTRFSKPTRDDTPLSWRHCDRAVVGRRPAFRNALFVNPRQAEEPVAHLCAQTLAGLLPTFGIARAPHQPSCPATALPIRHFDHVTRGLGDACDFQAYSPRRSAKACDRPDTAQRKSISPTQAAASSTRVQHKGVVVECAQLSTGARTTNHDTKKQHRQSIRTRRL